MLELWLLHGGGGPLAFPRRGLLAGTYFDPSALTACRWLRQALSLLVAWEKRLAEVFPNIQLSVLGTDLDEGNIAGARQRQPPQPLRSRRRRNLALRMSPVLIVVVPSSLPSCLPFLDRLFPTHALAEYPEQWIGTDFEEHEMGPEFERHFNAILTPF